MSQKDDHAKGSIEPRPQVKEVNVFASVGGKVALVKYDLSADYHYSMSRTWTIPEGWTEDEAKKFQQDKLIEVRQELEPLAQSEADELMEQSKCF